MITDGGGNRWPKDTGALLARALSLRVAGKVPCLGPREGWSFSGSSRGFVLGLQVFLGIFNNL